MNKKQLITLFDSGLAMPRRLDACVLVKLAEELGTDRRNVPVPTDAR